MYFYKIIYNFTHFSELFRNTANLEAVSRSEVRAMMDELKQGLLETYKEIALNHPINRPRPSHNTEPMPSTSGLNTKRYNPMSDDESDIDSDSGQHGSDVDYE